ncbi:MAG: MFS transporter [Candidatus Thorarchaeota archaeon]
MFRSKSPSKENKSSDLIKKTPDFNAMIRITFWNGLGFIFFMFIKSYVVIYYFGGSGVDLGVIMALQPLARLFSMPLIAYLTDHTSKKLLVLIGSMGRTVAYLLYWISLVIPNLLLFGIGTFVQGLIVAFFWPPFFSLISEKSFKGNRTQALATGRGKMIGYGFLLGAFISMPIFGLVSVFLPENIPLMYSPLLIFSLLNLIAGYRFYKKVDENLTYEKYCEMLENSNTDLDFKNQESGANKSEIHDDINNDRKLQTSFYIGFLAILLALLATSITGTIYSPFVSAYLIESLLPDFSENIVPIIVMIVYFPAQVISSLVASKFGKRYDRISPLLSVIVIGIFKSLMIWLLILAFSAFDFAIILIFLYIAVESNAYLIQGIMSRISIKHRGKVFGLNMWIDRLGRVIGPLIGGVLWDSLGYNIPFIISVYMGLCLIPLFMFAIRKLSPYMVEQVEIDRMGIIDVKNK